MRRRLRLYLVLLSLTIALIGAIVIRAMPHPPANNQCWSSPARDETAKIVWDIDDNLRYFIPRDFAGAYYHAAGGYRLTVGQPHDAAHTIWMIGSSTVWAFCVSDDETIPSYLQALTPDYRVVNVGMMNAAAVHEYNRLVTLPIRAGDVVVFYDGLMDVKTRLDSTVSLEEMADRYDRYLRKAEAFTRGHGAIWLHILQPHVNSIPKGDFRYANEVALFAESWPRLQAQERGVDLTHILDEARRTGECFYYDSHHVNAACNRIIAAQIYRWLAVW